MLNYSKSLFLFFVVVVLILLNTLLDAQSLDGLLKDGDKFTEEFNNQKALDTYLKADKMFPDQWEVKWRISRAYIDIGEHMPEKTDEQKDAQLAFYQKALSYAESSVKLAPDQSITYIRRAVANGRIALFKGVFSVGGIVTQVKEDCEKAIKLGNGGNYVQSLAHYVLGRTHAKVSEKWAPARAVLGLGWADLEIGIKELKKSTELYPNFRMFYLDLGKAYIEDGQDDKAKEVLNKLINSPKKDEDDDKFLSEAKQLLKEL